MKNSLTDAGYIRQLMEQNGISFQKKFGQNFLINPEIPRRIASFISGCALEIGPGAGCLTSELSKVCDSVAAVEIDGGLIPILAYTLRDCANVSVINADIMKVDLSELLEKQFGDRPVSVCANLPYNITTPVIMKLLNHGLSQSGPFDSIVVMVQKEVAERFAASPGSDAYGAVTASVAYFARVERLFSVSAGNFMPKPKVDSAVIRFIPYKTPPVQVVSRTILFRVIRGAFAQRRKTLVNSLSTEFSALGKNSVAQIISDCGFPADIRGERLSINDFAILSNNLCKFMPDNFNTDVF